MAAKTKKMQTKMTINATKPITKVEIVKKLTTRSSSGANVAPQVKNDDAALLALAGRESADQRKQKTIRDSFNMPAADYALIGVLKDRALKSAQHVKKSELFRAGLKALVAMEPAEFTAALGAVDSIKTGRPSKKS